MSPPTTVPRLPDPSSGRRARLADGACHALLGLTAAWTVAPLIAKASLPLSHDIVFHLFQANEFCDGLRSGNLLPRWSRDANFGYGGPNFVFYAPLSYYVVAAVRALLSDPVHSLVAAIWLGFFLSGAAMFAACRESAGRLGGLATALLYQTLPFHVMNLYARGAHAELFAYPLMPVVVWSVGKIFESDGRRGLLRLSLAYAALAATHIATFFMFSVFLAAYLLLRSGLSRRLGELSRAIASLILGLGLSSIYIVPALWERRHVNIDYLKTSAVGGYAKNFLFLPESGTRHPDAFSFALNLVVAMEVVVVLLVLSGIRKLRPKGLAADDRTALATAFFASVLLSSPLSRPVWEAAPFFPLLQFPWRWIIIMELCLCLLFGGMLSPATGSRGDPSARRPATSIAALLMLCVLLNAFFIKRNGAVLGPGQLEKIRNPGSLSRIMDVIHEYTPLGADDWRTIAEKRDRVAGAGNDSRVVTVEWEPERRSFRTDSVSGETIRVSTFMFPGWTAEIDGRPAGIRTERGTGAMLIDVPGGEHTVTLRFGETPVRRIAKYLSLGSLVLLVLISVGTRRRSAREGWAAE